MNRREAIKRTSLLMGGTMFAPSILAVMKGCSPNPGQNWSPQLFDRRQATLVTTLADTILPEDDHPAASALGVPQFIDRCVNETYTSEQQNRFLEKLDDFNTKAREELNSDFAEAGPDAQYRFASEQNRLALESDGNNEDDILGSPFFLVFKELTLLGYFTSEVGATQVLRYELNPGRFDGCAPLEEVGRTWAT